MEFATAKFLWFFMAVLTAAWSLRRHRVARNTLLLTASYLFCWKWQPLFLLAIIGSSVVNYGLGEQLFDQSNKAKRLGTLKLGLGVNLLFLGYFKYYGFFTDNLADLLGTFGLTSHLPIIEVIAPLGVSFYTFQAIAYLVDIHRGRAVRPKTLLDFLLFQSFFPQLAAGPICRSHELLPQIMAPCPSAVPQLSQAITLIGTGLFKKMILGTYLATHMVEDAFLAPSEWSTLELWVVVFAYTAQIYLDFSGYTDLARGVGLLLGFELPENFRYPYRSTNIGDYWRRWHITFSSWLREYIYFPLGGSRCSRLRCYTNLMLTFLACGIWHGANWGYVIWGGLHGIALIVYKASLDFRRDFGLRVDGPKPLIWRCSGWVATIGFCAIARIWFKTSDLTTAGQFWDGLFAGTMVGNGLELGVVVVTVLTFGLNFVGQPIFDRVAGFHERIPLTWRPVAWVGLGVLLLTLKPYGISPTTYFQF